MKTHYTFNLRDFSKVVGGISMASKKELIDKFETLDEF
jgi:hypothetical protein